MSENIKHRIREIPYNYTSYSDKEIVIKYLGDESWNVINQLRKVRKTGISARMLFEILGDIWIIDRNPFVQDDLLKNKKRLNSLVNALYHRLEQIIKRNNTDKNVKFLVEKMREAIIKFQKWLPVQKKLRGEILRKFSKITRKDNIDFSGLGRVTHVTDATDWRIEYPLAIIYPDTEEEIKPMIEICIKMGLTVITRGGGTCYTGSGIPLYRDTIVINLEKLKKIGKIEDLIIDNKKMRDTASIEVQTGVVTKQLIDKAASNGYIFAVDPTSQNASTIGGNIAMNAGGKKAVQWGTAIDNLISWKMVDAQANWVEIKRLNYKPGKLHENQYVEYEINRYKTNKKNKRKENYSEILKIRGNSFRKEGLGKDVTDKTLMGLPGVQKEGCDGIITSAVFALHKEPKYTRTICLEFFGSDLKKAVPAIIEIKEKFQKNKNVLLIGLEHLDERYLKAINYTTKTTRRVMPKMMILADITSNDQKLLDNEAIKIVNIANKRSGEGFIAKTHEARQSFWKERANTAAIAAHTNAFKVNEDVVIPLEKLNEYNTEIERMNIVLSTNNKIKTLKALIEYFKSKLYEEDLKLILDESIENEKIFSAKQNEALIILNKIEKEWKYIIQNLNKEIIHIHKNVDKEIKQKSSKSDTLFDVLQRRDYRISYKEKIEKPLKELFSGNYAKVIRKRIDNIHSSIRSSRLFIATHMHAGDGNVHTNIPVNSNDYEMLNEAHHIVEKIVKLVKSLGGVISGEHGIGITKFQFLEEDKKESFKEYKNRIDPNGVFNRGKLLKNHPSDLSLAYTPSLRLLELEALILEASELGKLNEMVKKCLRCGKCKPLCTTHVPESNLLYSPRNKILGLGLLIEAFLYEEQTRRGISINHFEELNDISDHCSLCHKCYSPCPVDIDFGEVTLKLRNILKDNKYVKSGLIHKIGLKFLEIKNPKVVKFARSFLMKPGFLIQRMGHTLFKKLGAADIEKNIPSTSCKLTIAKQLEHSMKMPLPRLKSKDLRSMLNIVDLHYVPIIFNKEKSVKNQEAVFYFPGCGCERLYVNAALSTIAVLYHMGIQVIIPPEYTCCGYPMKASGEKSLADKITVENRVLFHRAANTLNYLDIKTVIVSCGTCLEQLYDYQFDKIFIDSKIMDIHEFLYEKNISLKSKNKYIYHEPCHTPIKVNKTENLLKKVLDNKFEISERCCGEAGTMAIARPDISTQIRYKKLNELYLNKNKLYDKKKKHDNKNIKMITSCPACIQGLSRYRDYTNLKPVFLVEEIADNILGKKWQKKFIKEIKKKGIQKVLL
ncbi:MAG: DUF3683 domain-containing protein [Spirochaetia bacterium]|nr:DUF3683 domain-containing protein [Spirochaetia bacterium]